MNTLAFLSYVLVATITPGPNTILSMSNGHQFGYKNTLKFLLGIFLGVVIVILLCSYFNLLLYQIIPQFKLYMGVLGAVYMIYLAVKILKSEPGAENNDGQLNSFYNGFFMQFINPQSWLYGITVISNFIIPYYNSKLKIALFAIFLALMAFIAVSCWALFGAMFQKLLADYHKPFSIVMSALLLYSAFIISGVSNLF